LDRLIILNERHLWRVLNEYVVYFNERRPHQGLGQNSPLGLEPVSNQGVIRRRTMLGGIIRETVTEGLREGPFSPPISF
jgi:putative transposase